MKQVSATVTKLVLTWQIYFAKFVNSVPGYHDVVPLAVSVSPDEPDVCWILSYSEKELSQLQRNDPCLKKLIVWLQTDITPSQRELSLFNPTVKYFYFNRSHLSYQKTYCGTPGRVSLEKNNYY